ncbi:hypothetical protein [Georgenia halophila]|uniref:hypothetical protein n=1 Tax=Georgenia halophila TaxID=620889 RepID=UPI0031EA7BD1
MAVYAALTKDADAMRLTGDPRGKGQLMADLLTCRAAGLDLPEPLIGTDDAEKPGQPVAAPPPAVPQVVPAEIARLLIAGTLALTWPHGSDGCTPDPAAHWSR